MALLDRGCGDEFGGRSGAKILDDTIRSAISTWQPIASMVTRAPSSCPVSASWSRSSGMAVISLVFSGTPSCAKVSRAVVA
jgi:hypothetical protein